MDKISVWVQRQQDLLAMELREEEAQLTDKIQSLSGKNCELEGLSLLSLEVLSTQSELFGRCSVVLQKIGKHPLSNGFKVGDEVNLFSPKIKSNNVNDESSDLYGIVKHVSQYTIQIVIDEYSNFLNETPLRLDKRSSMTTHSKMAKTLKILKESMHPLADILFSNSSVDIFDQIRPRESRSKLTWFSSTLNESQKLAVKTALEAPRVAIIHGPPGTGKTSTLVELIMQCTQANLKVLVCAPSNIAVDTILLRLAQASSKGKEKRMVRLGHPARVSEAVLPFTLDHQINNDDGTEIVSDARKEVDNLRAELRKGYRRGAEDEGMTKRELKQELKAVRKEVVQREREIVRRIVANSQVILATCVGASSRLIENVEFDVVVIDEAAQGLEVACWIPMLLACKVVLAGDHCQLPPTIKCKEASKELSVTLFERIIRDSRYASVCTLLNIQYRMNDLISSWASRQMYHDEVVSDQSVATHSLADIVKATEDEDTIPVLLMIDTGGCCMYEASQTEQSVSHRNLNEVQLVVLHVISLLKQGVLARHIGVITPYNGQLEVLRSTFSSLADSRHAHGLDLTDLEVKTIDGFQGGEKECIIISLVRSNDRREVGFLGENRRINVAVTRAKRHLAVICDTETCSQDAFIGTLISHLEEHGEVLGAEDFLAEHVQDIKLIPADVSAQSSSSAKQQPTAKAPSTDAKKAGTSTKTSKSNSKPAANAKKIDTNVKAVNNATMQADKKTEDVEGSKFALEVDELLGKFKSGLVIHPVVSLSSVAYEAKCVATSSHLSLMFPCSLNSFERMIVHAAAEKHSLSHESKGEGSDRYIEVSKLLELPTTPVSEVAGKISGNDAVPPTESGNELAADDAEDSEEDNEDDTAQEAAGKSSDATTSKAKKKKSKSKPKSKTVLGPISALGATKPVKSNALPDIDDEDLLLQMAIEENQRLAEVQKYRMKGIRAMPNYEKEHAKDKVKTKLAEAQASRLSQQAKDLKSEGGTGQRTKTVKKPVPNFGCGKVGTL